MNETAWAPSDRSPVVKVSLSPLRVALPVTSSPSNVTRTPASLGRPLTSSTTVSEWFLTYESGPGVTAETRGTASTCQPANAANTQTAATTKYGQRR